MPELVRFDAPELVTFDLERRTIAGLALPYGPEARTVGGRYRFRSGSVQFSDLRRVKLLTDHDPSLPVGHAIAATDTPTGLHMTFQVGATPAGDQALLEAAEGLRDGLSVGVEVLEASTDGPVRDVTRARLAHVAQVALPAFDDARVTAVHASATTDPDPDPDDPEPDDVPDPEGEPVSDLDAAAPVPTTAAALVSGHPLDRQQARPIYGPHSQYSMVADAVHCAGRYGDVEGGAQRLAIFSKIGTDARATLAGREITEFAPPGQVSSDLSVLLPAGYRPDLFVGDLRKLRPATDQFRQVAIDSARTFTIPTVSATSGLVVVTAEEGTNPATGTITDTAVTVTPASYSGIYDVSRAAVDAATPGLDQIALAEMRETYARVTETALTTYLATLYADGADEDVVAAQTAAGGVIYVDKLNELIATFMAGSFLPPTAFLTCTNDMKIAMQAKSADHLMMQPVGAPGLAWGTQEPNPWEYGRIAGIPVIHSWSNADLKTFVVNRDRTWVFESPTLLFNYSEVLGPETIRLALFGYFGFANIKLGGVLELTRALA